LMTASLLSRLKHSLHLYFDTDSLPTEEMAVSLDTRHDSDGDMTESLGQANKRPIIGSRGAVFQHYNFHWPTSSPHFILLSRPDQPKLQKPTNSPSLRGIVAAKGVCHKSSLRQVNTTPALTRAPMHQPPCVNAPYISAAPLVARLTPASHIRAYTDQLAVSSYGSNIS
jgi:hypothetical protein